MSRCMIVFLAAVGLYAVCAAVVGLVERVHTRKGGGKRG